MRLGHSLLQRTWQESAVALSSLVLLSVLLSSSLSALLYTHPNWQTCRTRGSGEGGQGAARKTGRRGRGGGGGSEGGVERRGLSDRGYVFYFIVCCYLLASIEGRGGGEKMS